VYHMWCNIKFVYDKYRDYVVSGRMSISHGWKIFTMSYHVG